MSWRSSSNPFSRRDDYSYGGNSCNSYGNFHKDTYDDIRSNSYDYSDGRSFSNSRDDSYENFHSNSNNSNWDSDINSFKPGVTNNFYPMLSLVFDSGYDVVAKIDSNTYHSYIRTSIAESLQLPINRNIVRVIEKSPTETITTKGKVLMNASIQGMKTNYQLECIDDLPHPILLGRDWMMDENVVVDLQLLYVSFCSRRINVRWEAEDVISNDMQKNFNNSMNNFGGFNQQDNYSDYDYGSRRSVYQGNKRYGGMKPPSLLDGINIGPPSKRSKFSDSNQRRNRRNNRGDRSSKKPRTIMEKLEREKVYPLLWLPWRQNIETQTPEFLWNPRAVKARLRPGKIYKHDPSVPIEKKPDIPEVEMISIECQTDIKDKSRLKKFDKILTADEQAEEIEEKTFIPWCKIAMVQTPSTFWNTKKGKSRLKFFKLDETLPIEEKPFKEPVETADVEIQTDPKPTSTVVADSIPESADVDPKPSEDVVEP